MQFKLHLDKEGDGGVVSINSVNLPPPDELPESYGRDRGVYDMGHIQYTYDQFFWTAFTPISFS